MPALSSSRIARAAFACLPLLAAACSSGSDGPPADQPDAAAPPAQSHDAAPSRDAPVSPPLVDASIAPPPFVSNVPGATAVDVSNPKVPGLVLLSVNFLQQPSGGQEYEEWLGEVMNTGSTPVCNVSIDLTYEDASGNAVVTPLTSYAFADPYTAAGSTLSIPCIPPGGVGSFWTNGFAAAEQSTANVTTIAVKFGTFADPAAKPDPAAPTVTSQVMSKAIGYVISGTMAESAATVNNVGVRFFPRDPLGLVLAEFPVTDLGTLSPGAPYPFSTSGISTPFTQYRGYASYIEGAGMGRPRNGDGVAADPALLARLDAARAAHAANDARAALARSRR
jgi:hypothetical protein